MSTQADSTQQAQTQLADVVRAMRVRLERAITPGDAAPLEQPDLPPQLAYLVAQLDLLPFELDVLMLCLAWELDTRVAALCAAAQGDARASYPTFALALSMSSDPVWDALSPMRPLRRWQLLDLQPMTAQPLAAWPLRLDERVVNFLKGVQHVDRRWLPMLQPMAAVPATDWPTSQRALIDRIVTRLRSAAQSGQVPPVQLVARDQHLAERVAAQVARELGLWLHRLDGSPLAAAGVDLDVLLRVWERETLLSPVALLTNDETTDLRVIQHAGGLVFVTAREPREYPDRACLRFEVTAPTTDERAELWRASQPSLTPAAASQLAAQFTLDREEIGRVVLTLDEDARSDPSALWRACVDATVPRLAGLARRIETKASWDDLVLPQDELRTLHAMVAQARHRATVYERWGFGQRTQRGLALTALFAGESGTGKTLAAEVLAHELRIPLLCVDLSAVVDKYIGETEKNLRRVFDAAEDSGALLFFDEADALFGKRSEVKNAHDRFANIEINYLLQRIESYRGLVVLATNLKSALDAAFMRRLRFYVRFAFPAECERQVIWRHVFPPETPLETLDYERLASFALTGAAIRSVALNAAFLAADAQTPVSMPLILDALRSELRKLDQRLNEAQFRRANATAPVSHGAVR